MSKSYRKEGRKESFNEGRQLIKTDILKKTRKGFNPSRILSPGDAYSRWSELNEDDDDPAEDSDS